MQEFAVQLIWKETIRIGNAGKYATVL